jgi:hypothetical protein
MMTQTGLLVPVHFDGANLITSDIYAVCLGSGEDHPHGWTTSASAAVSLAAGAGVPFINGLSVDLTRGGEVLSWVIQVTP